MLSFSVHSTYSSRNLLIFVLVIVLMFAGCNSSQGRQSYENPESGISLEKPENWHAEYYERSGLIALETENKIRDEGSAHIEIYAGSCASADNNPNEGLTAEELIQLEIDRIRVLYNLDSITITQEATTVKNGDMEVTRASITVPTLSLPEDSSTNQVGDQATDVFQPIDIINIRDSNNDRSIGVFIYKGNSEELNAEAEEIVSSVQQTCPNEP